MTYANTTLLGLNQPTTGSESGVWGDDVNNGFTQLVDLAVAGTNNITQDSDITLAISNGSNSSTFTSTATNSTVAQYSTLNCTGSRGAIRNIIAPASSRTFVVINNTTGGFAIVIKKSGGTGVSIAPNETAIVYYDSVTATDYVKVSSTVNVSSFSAGTTGFTPSTATSGAVTLAGTLATTNGGTGLTSFTANGVVYASSTSALATGSALQFDGANLGLGVTPSAWESGAKVIQLSNAGAGGTSGDTCAIWARYDSLRLINGAYYNGSNFIYSATGVSPSFVAQFSDGSFVWAKASSGTAGGTVSFTQAMTLTNSGYLGIGTSSPSYPLSVVSTLPYASITGSGTGQYGLQFIAGANDSGTQVGGLTYNSSTGEQRLLGPQSYNFQTFYTGGSERARIDTSGNLGLGVTPSAWAASQRALDIGTTGALIADTSANSGLAHNAYYGSSAWTYKTTNFASLYSQTSIGQHVWYNAPSGTAGNAISFTQAMTLDNSGRLLVGLTSIVSGSSSYGNFAANGSTNYGITIQNISASNTNFMIFANNSGSVAGSISQNSSTSVLYNTTSDQRLKTDLGQVTSTSVIDNTIVHDFVWKSDGTQSRGVFAQEAHKVMPQAVKVGDDGEEVDDVWQVDYSKYVPDLIVYCQQLKAEIQSLKAEVATLKGA